MANNLLKNCLRKTKRAFTKKYLTPPDTFTPAIINRSNKPVIWLLGSEDFGNLGDHMIAEAQIHFYAKHFPEYDVIEVSARNYWNTKEIITNTIQPDDIIFGTGGGNFGNQYPDSEAIRYDFVKSFPNNKIIIMPQTVWYTKNPEGDKALKEAIEIYGNHPHLLITAREQFTYDFLKSNFKNRILFVPDMVLSEPPYISSLPKSKQHSKTKVIFCLRTDLEAILTREERKSIYKLLKSQYKTVKKIDTQKNYLISTEHRKTELKNFFEEISSANLMITDRLHGMVFAALCNTPCIVFDNYNNKVKGIYQWIKELPYICYKGTDKNIADDISRLQQITTCDFHIEGMNERFAEYANAIKIGKYIS